MSSTQDDGQLDVVDSIKEKDTETLRESGSNAYNPYDPKSTPFEIHITTAGGGTTTTTATPSTTPTGSTMTEMDYDLLNAPAQNAPRQATSCPWKCELTNDRGYVLYSALGSFYIPMFVMLFFYWRIYRAAVRTTRAINQGFKTTKGKWESQLPYHSYPMSIQNHLDTHTHCFLISHSATCVCVAKSFVPTYILY